MRNLLASAVVATALWAAKPAAAQPSDEAIVAASLPDTQFRGFLMRTVAGTDSFKRAFIALGAERGCEVFRPAFATAFDSHVADWRANLVRAWRDNVPADLLEKAVEAGPGEAGRLVAPHGEAIGEAMEKASTPLLTQATAEILAALAEHAKDVDAGQVDEKARVAELNALDTRNFCGVLRSPADTDTDAQEDGAPRPGPEQGR